MARNPNSDAAWLRGQFLGSIKRMSLTCDSIQKHSRDDKEDKLAADINRLLFELKLELRTKK